MLPARRRGARARFERDAILAALARLVPPRRRLLVVDDDPQVVDLVCQLLEGEPYEVEAAMDGLEALEAVARQRPEVILLDLLMPRVDGFGILENLQQDPSTRELPVLVLTAKTRTVEEKTLLQQRVRTVIQQPGLDRDTLIQAWRDLLQAYRGSTPKE